MTERHIPHWSTLRDVGQHCMAEPGSARGISQDAFVDGTFELIREQGGNPFEFALHYEDDGEPGASTVAHGSGLSSDFSSEPVYLVDGVVRPLGSTPVPHILEALGISVKKHSQLGELLDKDPERARSYAEDEWIRYRSEPPTEGIRRAREQIQARSGADSTDERILGLQLAPPQVPSGREPTEDELAHAWRVAAAAAIDAEVAAQMAA